MFALDLIMDHDLILSKLLSTKPVELATIKLGFLTVFERFSIFNDK
jgi:hypothetical protein